MTQFTIPQRKAYVRMLEELRDKVKGRYRYENPERDAAEAAAEKQYRLPELKAKLEEAQKKVNAQMETVDKQWEVHNRKLVRELTLAIASVWGCESAAEAKELVERFVTGLAEEKQ